jgi:hypothetical protein
MLVFVSSSQLLPLVERAISERFDCEVENLKVDSRFLRWEQSDWVVGAEFDVGGRHRRMELVLDPRTGLLLRTSEA